MIRSSLDQIKKSNAASELNFINRGIEKECLRVDALGAISQTDHPLVLGSALTNPFITTDFSEALLELVTPTFNSAEETISFLTALHVFVNKNLENESLWPMSMPCSIDSDNDIRIGSYGTSNQGMMKTIYRRGLSNRYGSMMQAIAGIHYNFSFSDKFIEILSESNSEGIKDYKNKAYLKIARNFRRYGWIYLLLFGSSPLTSNAFARNRTHDLEELITGDLYKPYATSLRMGDLGYISHAQDSLNISYNSLEEYCLDLKNALNTSYDKYKEIGEFKNGKRIQLNSSIIQIENEYYSTIRPKRVCPSGERPINVLREEGIDYLELRCIDLNPNSHIGITEEQIYFLDLLILYCFFMDSPEITTEESNELFKTHKTIVNEGRKPDATINTLEGKSTVEKSALEIISGMEEIAIFMDQEVTQDGNNSWLEKIQDKREMVNNLDLSLSGSLLKEIKEKGMSFQEYSMNLSLQHNEKINSIPESETHNFDEVARNSLNEAKNIEQAGQADFEVYLKEFLSKIS